MASRYWVSGGTGNWSSSTNWSTTSGGASGAAAPTLADDVFVDANSGTSPTITLDATSSCLSLDLTGALTPTITGVSNLNIFGSLTLCPAATLSGAGTTVFASTSTGKTITRNGATINRAFSFSGVGGGWTFQDSFISSSTVAYTNGALNTNGFVFNCTTFSTGGAGTRTLTLGASILSVSSFGTLGTTNLTVIAGTSTINCAGSFAGGTNVFNIVNLTGSGSLRDSNTFATLSISAGKTISVESLKTQTITNLICNGTAANPSTLQALTSGSPATIALPAGRYFIRHTSIKDITVSGATAVTSIAGTNVSGNTGITFVTKFEMGRIKNDGSFNWYNSTTGTVTKVSG